MDDSRSAAGAAVFAVVGIVGLVMALATELVARGMPASLAILIVALLCVVGSAVLGLQLRALTKRALFGHSRNRLRGKA